MSHVLDKTACRLTGTTARAAIAAAAMALMASLVPSPASAARTTCEVESRLGRTTTYQCRDDRGNRYRMECEPGFGGEVECERR
jgi:hypothetical protein